MALVDTRIREECRVSRLYRRLHSCINRAPSRGRRGDLVEGEPLGFGADLGHRDGGDRHDDGDHHEHGGQAEALLDPQEGRDRHKGSDTTGGLAEPKTGGAGVGREHLGDEDLRRISRQLDEEDHSEPDRQHHPLAPALAQSSPNTAVRRKAVTAVGLRPKRSSEYIIKALAHGKARVIQKIEFSDLAIGKPRSTRMFGSQAPSPSAMPKKAKKQIIPAITGPGYSRRTMPSGALLVSLAAPVRSDASGTVRSPMRCSRSSARCPWPWVASQRGDSGRETQNENHQRTDADDDPDATP